MNGFLYPQPCSVLRRFFLAANLPQDAKLIPTKTHLPISRREFFISTVVGLTVLKFATARAQESSSTPFLERHMIAEPLNAHDVGMVHHEMRRQKLGETINIACVHHLLEKATYEQLVF